MSDRCVALFCGSRAWKDERTIAADVAALPPGTLVVHGVARGADTIAGRAARARGLFVAEVDVAPYWRHYAKAAGQMRNEAMLLLLPTIVYAYSLGDTPGTAGMIARAIAAGVPVIERRP